MGRYAEGTDVPVENSKAEIERTLRRYGVDQMAMPLDFTTGAGQVMFRKSGRWYKFTVEVPPASEFRKDPAGRQRPKGGAERARENELKRRWRVLVLQIKAKCEAAESGMSTFEAEFFTSTLLPNQKTAGEHFAPAIEQAYESGKVPDPGFLLPAPDDA